MMEKCFSKADTNGVKGVAILFMMFHHCFATKDRFENYDISFFPFSQEMGVLISFSLKICVGMFVFLSAYGMTVSMKKKNENYTFSRQENVNMTTSRLWHMLSGYMLLFLVVHLISQILREGRFQEVYGTGVKAVLGVCIDFFGLGDVLGTPMFLATWWYMSVAVILILALPLLIRGYRTMGLYFVGLFALLPFLFEFKYTNITRYLLVMALGVAFADGDWIVKVREWKCGSSAVLGHILKFVMEIAVLYVLFRGRNSEYGYKLVGIWDSLIPIVFVLLVFEFVLVIPGVRQVLIFIGKYSMNIFLVHNFFRVFWCPDFIYGVRSAWLAPLVLLLISLAFSVALEGVKKLIHFGDFVKFIEERITIGKGVQEA